jgi:hypothetical protein
MLLYASNGKPTKGLIRDQQRLQSEPLYPHTTSYDNTMARVSIIKILSYLSPLLALGNDLQLFSLNVRRGKVHATLMKGYEVA